MNLDEMKKLSTEQLIDLVGDTRKELFKLSVNASLEKKAEAPHKFKLLRKQIARANTLITQNKSQAS